MFTQKRFFRNTVKSGTVILGIFFLFFIIISVIPLISAVAVSHYPLGKIISENVMLILPLLIMMIPVGILLGWVTTTAKSQRILKTIMAGSFGYAVVVLFCMLFFTRWDMLNEGAGSVVILSSWTMLTYSLFTLPMIVLGMIVLEYWTRRRHNKFSI